MSWHPRALPLPGHREPPRVTPLTPVSPQAGRLHGSVPNLSRYLESSQSQLPFSVPPEYSQLQRSFWVLAQKGGMGRGPEPGWGSRGGFWGC